MHRRLDSASLSQLAFPGECNPNFPWEKTQWDNAVVKIEEENRSMVIEKSMFGSSKNKAVSARCHFVFGSLCK